MFREVHTQETQANLTPESVLRSLKEGNERFVSGKMIPRDYTAQVKKTAIGQFPEAVILSCIDSRVPVEHVFDKGFGDVFVVRIAGNFINNDILGSIEFSTAVAGSKVVLILGHRGCGAVKAAIDDVELGNITGMLAKIKPAIDMMGEFDGEKNSDNEAFVDKVVFHNVEYAIGQLREQSPIVAELETKNEIAIVGAVYDIETGRVSFLEA